MRTTLWVSLKVNMVLTYKDIQRILFPVFSLPSSNIVLSDGILYIDNYIIDDRNMEAETLGLRRLKTPMKPLYKLNKAITGIEGILKSNHNTFIQQNGAYFIYEKTKFLTLKYLPILGVELKETASILHLKGIRFTIPRPPPVDVLYAGVLYYYNRPWLLYEYSAKRFKNTRRKV